MPNIPRQVHHGALGIDTALGRVNSIWFRSWPKIFWFNRSIHGYPWSGKRGLWEVPCWDGGVLDVPLRQHSHSKSSTKKGTRWSPADPCPGSAQKLQHEKNFGCQSGTNNIFLLWQRNPWTWPSSLISRQGCHPEDDWDGPLIVTQGDKFSWPWSAGIWRHPWQTWPNCSSSLCPQLLTVFFLMWSSVLGFYERPILQKLQMITPRICSERGFECNELFATGKGWCFSKPAPASKSHRSLTFHPFAFWSCALGAVLTLLLPGWVSGLVPAGLPEVHKRYRKSIRWVFST